MKDVSETSMLQVWETAGLLAEVVVPYGGRGYQFREKDEGLVWDILSFKRWQNNPKRMSSTELEESGEPCRQ